MMLWLYIGVGLMVLELIIPVGYFVWLGMTALSLSYFMYLMPEISLVMQGSLFIAVSASVSLWWRWYKHQPKQPHQDPTLILDSRPLIGKVFTLEKDMKNGKGRIEWDGIIWRYEAYEDYEAGTEVKVYTVDGFVLRVQTL